MGTRTTTVLQVNKLHELEEQQKEGYGRGKTVFQWIAVGSHSSMSNAGSFTMSCKPRVFLRKRVRADLSNSILNYVPCPSVPLFNLGVWYLKIMCIYLEWNHFLFPQSSCEINEASSQTDWHLSTKKVKSGGTELLTLVQ